MVECGNRSVMLGHARFPNGIDRISACEARRRSGDESRNRRLIRPPRPVKSCLLANLAINLARNGTYAYSRVAMEMLYSVDVNHCRRLSMPTVAATVRDQPGPPQAGPGMGFASGTCLFTALM